MKDYNYPIDVDWSTEEIIEVVNLLELVENAYESRIESRKFLDQYRKFQNIMGGKMHEKRVEKDFADASGYSIFAVYKKALESDFVSLRAKR